MALTPWGRRREAARDAALVASVTEQVTKAVTPALATRGAVIIDRSGMVPESTGGPIPGTDPRSPFSSYQALRRDSSVFGGPFGPGTPLRPAAIDPLRPDGRTDPRLTQYDPARNLNLSDRTVPFAILRSMADQVDVIRRCIEIRKASLTGYDWTFTLTKDVVRQVMAETGETNQARAAQTARKTYGTQIDQLNEFWESPDRANGHTWSEWLNQLLEEHFVLDALPIWPRPTFGGGTHSFEILDGSTIKPLLDLRGARPTSPDPAYQQILWGFPRGEFVESDNPDTEFVADQLYYGVRNKRTWSPYGLSAVEQSIPAATLWLERQAWHRAEYTAGTLPLSWAELNAGGPADQWTPDQRIQYEQSLNDELAGKTDSRQGIKLLFPGMTLHQADRIDEKYKPEYDEFLIKRIGSNFGVAPTQLGVIPRSGIGGKGQQEGEQDQSETVSEKPDLKWLVDVVNELSIRYLGMDRAITLKFDTGDDVDDSETAATSTKTYVSVGARTLNDVRADRGQPLYDMPEADEPMIITTTGPVFLRGMLEKQLNPPPPPPMIGMLPPAPAPQDQGSVDPDDLPEAKPVEQKPAEPAPTPPVSKDDEQIVEAKKFLTYTRRRAGRLWRDFEFGHVDKSTGAMLNMYARNNDITACERVVTDMGKGAARSDRPGHTAETRILDKLTPSIRTGLTNLLDPHTTAATVYAHVGTTKSIDDLTDQIRRLLGDLDLDDTTLDEALTSLYKASYVAGRAAASGQVQQVGGTITADIDQTAITVDWSMWEPGDEQAAAQLALTDTSSGLASLLDQAGVTIKGVTGTTLDRMSTRLADALAHGDSVDTAAADIEDLLSDPTRAYLIAQTEMCRAVGVGTLDTYGQNGVSQKEWLTIDGGCDLCSTAEGEGPIPLDDTFDGVDDTAPPGHPGCLCTLLPVIGNDQ